MIDDRDTLNRLAHLFPLPDGGFEDVRRRRDRKRRRARLASATLALVLTMALIGGFLVLLRAEREAVPTTITPETVSELDVAWSGDLRGNAGSTLRHGSTQRITRPAVSGDTVFGLSHGANVSGFSSVCGSGGATCERLWSAYPVGGSPYLLHHPPVAAEGHLFVGTGLELGGSLTAFPEHCTVGDEACESDWYATLPGWPTSSPVVSDGLVVVQVHWVDGPGYVLAFDADCGSGGERCAPRWMVLLDDTHDVDRKAWQVLQETTFAPTVADGVVYAVDLRDDLYAIDARNGFILWKGPATGGDLRAGLDVEPAVADGKVLVSVGSPLHAYPVACGTDGDLCEEAWVAEPDVVGRDVRMSAPVVADGVAYITTDPDPNSSTSEGILSAYPMDCAEGCVPRWTASVGSRSGRPIVADGNVYVTSFLEGATVPTVAAFAAACATSVCEPRWLGELATPDIAGEPQWQDPVTSGGLVFVATLDRLLAFDAGCVPGVDARCDPLWSWTEPNGASLSAPVIDGDRLFVLATSGALYAFTPEDRSTARTEPEVPTSGGRGGLYAAIAIIGAIGVSAAIWARRRRT